MIFIKVLRKFGGLTAKQDVGSNEKFTFSAAFLTRVMDIYISQSEMNQNLLFVLGNSTGRIKFNFSTTEARRLNRPVGTLKPFHENIFTSCRNIRGPLGRQARLHS